MDMPMDRLKSSTGHSDRPMGISHQMSNVRNMYQDSQDMTSNMMDQEMSRKILNRNMMGQGVRSNLRDIHRQNQALEPNQYFKNDGMGNFVYAYDDQFTEKKEEGHHHGDVKGHYAYTMPNGIERQVDYVADNNGFHVRDNADPARIKRSSEPSFVNTKMTSVIDSSSMNHGHDMHRMSNMMGRDMPTQMDRNMMGTDQQRYSNIMMGQNTMGGKMISQNNLGRNMMGQDINNIMSNRGMTSGMSNMMGHGRTMEVMGHNLMGQDRTSQMMSGNIMGHQDMTPNLMYINRMGHNLINNQMSSKAMNTNNGLVRQRMMQQMEMRQVPETYTSSRLF